MLNIRSKYECACLISEVYRMCMLNIRSIYECACLISEVYMNVHA